MKQLPKAKEILSDHINRAVFPLIDESNLEFSTIEDVMKEYGRQVRDYTLDLAAKNAKLTPPGEYSGKQSISEESIIKLKKDKRLQI